MKRKLCCYGFGAPYQTGCVQPAVLIRTSRDTPNDYAQHNPDKHGGDETSLKNPAVLDKSLSYVESVRRYLRGKEAEPLSHRILWTNATAGRRFEQTGERLLKDVQSGQQFRLLPRRDGLQMMLTSSKRVIWRSRAGYAFAMAMLVYAGIQRCCFLRRRVHCI